MPEQPQVSAREIIALLDEKNLSHSARGFPFLVEAIKIVCSDKEVRDSRKIMVLYELVSESFQETPSRVERAIRSALSRQPTKTSNGQFIYWAADLLCSAKDTG